MSVFHFKRFDVRNEKSAMKVNTDGVLLGAATEVFPGDMMILDIGTGTGTVALMIAQRLSALSHSGLWNIRGIDIDAPSSEEAAENFLASPWKENLVAENVGLSAFKASSLKDSTIKNSVSGNSAAGGFDLIVSNPPYYDNSLEAPEARRNSARHTGDPENPSGAESLSYREILEYASVALAEDGRISMILPADQEKALMRHARMCGFVPWKILRIRSVERKPVSRLIAQFRRRGQSDCTPEEAMLTLLNEKGKRTSQHASLVTDYYL